MHHAPRKGRALLALLAMTVLLVSGIQAATSFGSHGSQVKDTDNDYAVHYEALAPASSFVCRVDNGAGGVTDDHFYLHWAADCTGAVARGDVRLTTTGGGAAGTVVKSADSDKDISFDGTLGSFLAGVGYLETDGIIGYTPGDFLYYSADASLDAINGDVRLSTGSTNGVSTTAGTLVSTSSQADVTEAGDADGTFPESVALLDRNTFVLRVHDADADGAYDEETDRLYLTPASPTSFPRIGDLHLSNADGQTFGSKVTSTSADYTYQLTTITPSLVTTDADTSSLNARHLFMHFSDVDGTDDDVWQNDVVIKGGSSFGTRVTTAASGHGEVVTGTVASFATQLFWLDVDGDNKYSPGSDPVYLNRNTAALGDTGTLTLTAGDVRITAAPTGGYAAGTVVAAADSDLTAYNSLSGNDGVTGAWFVLLHDADQSDAVDLTTLSNGRVTGSDGVWNSAVDGAYVAAGSTLANSDTRLKATPFLGNTILDCDGTGADHGDCGGALTDDPQFATTGSAITTWAATTSVYHDTDGDLVVDAGETRIYHPTLAPGAVVGGDADEGTTVFVNGRVSGVGAFSDFAVGAAGPSVYWDANDDGTISTSDLRLYHTWTQPAAAPAADSDLSCPSTGTKDDDCGAAVTADSNIRVTGDDATYHEARSEYVYHSRDARVNTGDTRFLAVGALAAGTTVAASDADVTRVAPTSGDQIYLSWCEGACGSHPTGRLTVGDIQLVTSAGTRVTDATTGHAVTLTAVGTNAVDPFSQAVLQFDLGDSGTTTDDGYYLSFGTAGTKVGRDDIRLVPVTISGTKAAGTYVESSDSAETGATMARPVNVFTSAVKYADLDSDGAYSEGDGVYLDLGTAGLNSGDIRLTPVTASGVTYQAGTFALSGDKDVVSYVYHATQPTWTLYYFDEDRDGTVDDSDTVYVLPGTAVSGDSLDLLAVRIGGAGGSTTGSGGTTTPTTPPPTTTPPADDDDDDDVPDDDVTDPGDDNDTADPPVSEAVVSAANQAIADSLRVQRRDGTNHLSWDDVSGEAGYQVWRSDSPYVHVADLPAGSAEYADEDGGAKSDYLVTAFFENDDGVRTGYSDGVDADGNPDVPGMDGLEPSRPKKETPGLPLVGLLAALGLVAAVRRRR